VVAAGGRARDDLARHARARPLGREPTRAPVRPRGARHRRRGRVLADLFISIFLASVYGAITEVLLLLGFGVLVAGAARLALGACPPSLVRVVRDTLHTTGQAGVRASIFFLALLVFVAGDAGFEFVLGAFAAGLVVGLVLDSPEGRVVRLRLEGIGFGFLVPVYFVVTGMAFDLDSLLTMDGVALAGLPRSSARDARRLGAAVAERARRAPDREPCVCAARPRSRSSSLSSGSRRTAGPSRMPSAPRSSARGMLSVLVYPLAATRLIESDARAASEPDHVQ